ncbi:hypothetical protein AX15_002010 [Amanita polypyramis BW_CC]|nr:hypothetical protein AX15_002010 [Amanita polypyramis BW_CC]
MIVTFGDVYIRLFLVSLIAYPCCAYQPIGRWGHRTATTSSGLFIYGGKSDQFNSYSYTSAPNINDLLFLPLSNSFDSSSPPWQLLSESSVDAGPAVSWHTISTVNDTCLLLFGGLPGPNSATVLPSLADSVYFLDLQNGGEPSWGPTTQSWANEPIRRVRHSASPGDSGLVFIVGGEKADGSANAFPDNYIFDPSIPSFTQLSNSDGPSGIYDHASIMLSDGRLLVLGGYYQPQNTLIPFTNIWSFDTRSSSSTWSLLSASNATLPNPRRAFAATLLVNDRVLIHGGGDADLQQNYADGWVLDTSTDPMAWTSIDMLTKLGARRDHSAVSINSGHQVLFGFGYGDSGPMSPMIYIYDLDKNEFVTTFTPSPTIHSSSQMYPQHTSPAHSIPSATRSGEPTTGAGSNSRPDTHNSDSRNRRPRNTALAAIAGLAIVVAVLIALYRRYRRQHRRNNYFSSLGDDDASERSHPIPAVIMVDQDPISERSERRPVSRLFKLLHFPGSPDNGRSTERAAPVRRDMLADEDAYDDYEWYHLKHTRDAERSSWSLKSFVSNHLRSREPSATDLSANFHWHEKFDPFNAFSEDVVLLGGSPSHPVRDSISNTPTYLPYRDPFMDPTRSTHGSREWVGGIPANMQLATRSENLPWHDFSLRSQITIPSPPREQTPQLLPGNDSSGTSTEQAVTLSRNSVPDVSLIPTSLINANPTPMSRADSWWKRFTRSSFLDRKISSTSRKSPSIDAKECNVLLMPIGEQVDSLALKSVLRRSVEVVDNQVKPRSALNIYEGPHERSLSSLRTANTDGVNKIGGAMDIIRTDRTMSNQSSRSSMRDMNIGTEQSDRTIYNTLMSDGPTLTPTQLGPLDDYLADANRVNTTFGLSPSSGNIKLDLVSPACIAPERPSRGLVIARVQAYERRLSQDNDINRGYGREQENITSTKYRLAPRQSLFIANP